MRQSLRRHTEYSIRHTSSTRVSPQEYRTLNKDRCNCRGGVWEAGYLEDLFGRDSREERNN